MSLVAELGLQARSGPGQLSGVRGALLSVSGGVLPEDWQMTGMVLGGVVLARREARVAEVLERKEARREARAAEVLARREARVAEVLERKEARKEAREARRIWAAEQRRIQRIRRYQRGWERPTRKVVRLDRDSDDGRGSVHEIVSPIVDPFDPQRWVEAELLDALVGDLSITEIQAMTDEQLRPLRERLIAEGFASGRNVQTKERNRLRLPERHRGAAPAPTFEHMSTRYKHRKPGHRSSAGGDRPSQKPRGHRDRKRREKVVW